MANAVVEFLNNQAANGIYKSITKFSLFFKIIHLKYKIPRMSLKLI